MILATVLIWAVIVYFALSIVQLAWGSAATARELRAPQPAGDARTRFLIVLPVLREERIVAATVTRFAGFAAERDDVEIVVAATARERDERAADGAPARPLTLDVARESAARVNAAAGRELVRLVEAPADALGKVGQLNAAVAAWRAAGGGRHDARTYVGVYDADSAPDFRVFDAISAIVGARTRAGGAPPEILQQVSCYCQNLDRFGGVLGMLSIADAIAQTRWALGFEYQLYRRYADAVRRRRLRPLVYCVGHGCFVSDGYLERIGGFPTLSPTDDLALGYLTSALGAPIEPIPVLDYCDVAPNPFASIRQSRFWYHGSARFAADLGAFRAAYGTRNSLLQSWFFLLDGHGRRLAWAWRAAWMILALVLALALGLFPLAFALIALHVLYVQAGFVQTVMQIRRIPQGADKTGIDRIPASRLLLSGALASFTFVLRSLGPLTASIGLITPVRGWKMER